MAQNPYSLPEIYDIAFSFRDYPKAVDFLAQAAATAGLEPVKSMVELGCGPGQYCREFARRGVSAYGIDSAREMVEYANRLCRDDDLSCEVIEADMRDFSLPEPVDLAVCMMATFHLLLTNRDIVTHLDCVAENVRDGGLYIIELSHPRDMFESGQSTKNVWEMDNGYVKVETDWGSDAVIDPLTEIETGTIKFTVTRPTITESHTFMERWREISAGLIRALIELSGQFRIAAMYGDLDTGVPFDNSDKAWRMVLVLRKM